MRLLTKNISYSLPIGIALIAAILFSCSKEIRVDEKQTTPGETPVSVDAAFTAIIGSDTFKASPSPSDVKMTDTAIFITAINSKGDQIRLTINDTNVGIFVIDTGVASASYSVLTAGETFLANNRSSNGQVNITSIDKFNKVIKGNFAFVGRLATNGKTRTVSQGVFKLNYVYTGLGPIDENDTTLNVNPNRGANYMRAVFDSDTVVFSGSKAASFYYLGNLNLTGVNNKYGIYIAISPKSALGVYPLGGNFGVNSAYYKDSTGLKYKALESDSEIEITLNDTVARHMRGTFYLKTEAQTSPVKTQEIKDGEIDFYY